MIPVLRTRLPPARAVAKYLETLDDTRQYSNFGVLHEAFSDRLAEHYGCAAKNIALMNSCTSALLALLIDYASQRGKQYPDITVLLPAWSFIATLQVPLALGMNIRFCDTDETGTLDMERARAVCANEQIDVVIPVAPFGRALDLTAWNRFARDQGIAVFVDAAAGFYSTQCTDVPVAVSLHATKIFSCGEGGFVLGSDTELISRLRRVSNFGILGSRTPGGIGLNFKLSEYACAVGLASFDSHEATATTYLDQLAAYGDMFSGADLVVFFGDRTPRTTMNVAFRNADYASVDSFMARLLTDHGIQTLRWWKTLLPQCLEMFGAADATGAATTYPTAEALNATVVGLPLGPDLDATTIRRIAETVEVVAQG